MRKKLLSVVFAVVAAGAIVLGTQTAAQAETRGGDTSWTWVQQDSSTGFCRAESPRVGTNVSGIFMNYMVSYGCTGWLERSTNNGSSWTRVSGYHDLAEAYEVTNSASTNLYYDGNYYVARACFRMDFAGAATHCTWPV